MPDILQTLEFEEIRKMVASHAASSLSKKLALQLRPSSDPDTVADMLEDTDEAFICLQKEAEQPLGETFDITETLRKAHKHIILTPREFIDLASSLETYQKMHDYFSGNRHLAYPSLEKKTEDMVPEDALIRRIGQIFDDHAQVNDNASPKLHSIRGRIETLKGRIRTAFQKVLHNKDELPYFQDAIVTQRNGRFVIPVKAEFRSRFEGIVHDRSSSGETLFMEPLFSIEMNNDLEELRIAEKQEIHQILLRLTQVVAQNSDSIRQNCEIATEIELIFAKGALAIDMHGVKAIPSDKGELDLVQARHPLIAADKVVPVSFSLNKTYQILIITGANAGGKTINLKTAGLLSLMNQSGLFIPAAEGSTLPVYQHVYAIIGDDQSIEYNLSTFSSYITQLVDVLRHASSRDLVLLDELGSGTDPVEGASLAVSVTDYFYSRHIPCIITSHFSEMKKLAYENRGIENAFVEFNEETLTPTYHLMIGVAGNSNAFSLCKRLGIPDDVLQKAEELKRTSPFYNMESVMHQLNAQMRQLEREKADVDIELAETESLQSDLKKAASAFYDKRDSLLEKAREEAENMKRELRVQSEAIIRDLKKKSAMMDRSALADQISKVRQSIDGIELPRIKSRKSPIPRDQLKKGLYVYIDTLDNYGTVLSISGKKVTVQCGALKVTVTPEHCFEAEKPRKTPLAESKFHYVSPIQNQAAAVHTTINVIGKTVDEAVPEVDRFLNDAFMAGISPVQIIHGKGTGMLKKGIREYLKTIPFVTKFTDASPSNGGSGVTEVYF